MSSERVASSSRMATGRMGFAKSFGGGVVISTDVQKSGWSFPTL